MDADYRAVAVNLHDRGDSSGPLGAPTILPVACGIRHKGLRCLSTVEVVALRQATSHLRLKCAFQSRWTVLLPTPRRPYKAGFGYFAAEMPHGLSLARCHIHSSCACSID